MTDKDREAYEAWMQDWYIRTPLINPTPAKVWQAATAIERERAARVCEENASDADNPAVAYSCADKIRSGE